MERDQLYANPDSTPEDGSFVFDDAVARVFPDMLRRSIPGYAASLRAIETLARRHVKPNTQCYDLGCSLGAATLAMAKGSRYDNCRITAIDSAPAMVARCREIIAERRNSCTGGGGVQGCSRRRDPQCIDGGNELHIAIRPP